MKNLVKKIGTKELTNYLFVMDNCTIYLTKGLKEFYKHNKMKVLTIVPYKSEFNGVEFFLIILSKKYIKKFLFLLKN